MNLKESLDYTRKQLMRARLPKRHVDIVITNMEHEGEPPYGYYNKEWLNWRVNWIIAVWEEKHGKPGKRSKRKLVSV